MRFPSEGARLSGENKNLVPKGPSKAELRQKQQERLVQILPQPKVMLDDKQRADIEKYQEVINVLGPAGAAPMICSKQCPVPIRSTCPLAAIGQDPVGYPCPFETQLVVERYFGYLEDLDKTEEEATMAEKSLISSLVALDLQERRCNQALSYAENALMTALSVRNVDPKTGSPSAYEHIMHVNAQRLDEILERKKEILTALELTPEAQTRRLKHLSAIKQATGSALATRLSKLREKVFGPQEPVAPLSVEAEPLDEKPKPAGRKKKDGTKKPV